MRIEGPDFWARKATVLSEVGAPPFIIKTEDGQGLRRNRRTLLKTIKVKKTESEQNGATLDVNHRELPSPSLKSDILSRFTQI